MEESKNVVRTMRELLSECSLLDKFNGIHVDYTIEEDVPGALGLFSMGTTKTGEDILGNERYRIGFQLQTGLTAYEDYERLRNSDFLLQLTYWLNRKKNIRIVEEFGETERLGKITTVSAGNALLFDAPTGDVNDGVVYQLQVTVDYIIYA